MNKLGPIALSALMSVLSAITVPPAGAHVLGNIAGAVVAVTAIPISLAGHETATRPWSAPVGHRQPRAADAMTPTPNSPDFLDQENASVDRKIKGVCVGC